MTFIPSDTSMDQSSAHRHSGRRPEPWQPADFIQHYDTMGEVSPSETSLCGARASAPGKSARSRCTAPCSEWVGGGANRLSEPAPPLRCPAPWHLRSSPATSVPLVILVERCAFLTDGKPGRKDAGVEANEERTITGRKPSSGHALACLTVAELPPLTREGGRAASMGLRSLSQEAPPP